MSTQGNETWVPHLTLPHKLPNYPLNIPGQLVKAHFVLCDKLPDVLSRLILQFSFPTCLHSRLIREIHYDFSEVHAFYCSVMYSDKRVADSPFWLPLPYWHELRDKAIKKFIDFSVIPWVENNPELPHIHI